MPAPVVEPIPLPFFESRFGAPEEAQDASYLAASARISSLVFKSGLAMFSFCSFWMPLSMRNFRSRSKGLFQ